MGQYTWEMIHLVQLVYVHPGKEDVFHEFEDVALGLLSKYRGQLVLRLRPPADATLVSIEEPPYEVHVVSFESDDDLSLFMADEERQRFLHLKSDSVRATLTIKGTIA